MNEARKLKRKADLLLEDSELEAMYEIADGIKKQTRDGSEERTKLIDIQNDLLKTQSIQANQLKEIIKIAASLKVDLPDKFEVVVSNQKEYPKEISVSNLQEIKIPEALSLKKPDWYKESNLTPIIKEITKIWEVLKEEKTLKIDLSEYQEKNNPLSVRLTDGKEFYKAVMAVYGGGGGFDISGLATATKQDDIITELGVINSLTPSAYDYIALTYTGDNLTGVVFKTGGAGGTTVSTLTLAYTGSVLDSVTQT